MAASSSAQCASRLKRLAIQFRQERVLVQYFYDEQPAVALTSTCVVSCTDCIFVGARHAGSAGKTAEVRRCPTKDNRLPKMDS
jgi:hypothetical protein